VTGTITVEQSKRMANDVLTSLGSDALHDLQLKDGRLLQVSFNRIDPIAGVYRVRLAPGNAALD
jgi:hypothetical protein